MRLNNLSLYLLVFSYSCILSLILTPTARAAALILKIIDHPSTIVKTHKEPVPYLGGVAIFLSFTFALLWVRVLTSFPSGTLKALRGIIIGGGLIFAMGLIDDIKSTGLHYREKFAIQTTAACLVIFFGISIKFIQPGWLGLGMTLLWIVGITNAFNIIDTMDGLSSGIAVIASLAFLFISLPTEEIYVNFAAAALAGATLGFMPYNLSKNWRLFMGDSGSLFLGFVISSLALGTSYGATSKIAVLAPVLILLPVIFETCLVFYLRTRRGMSPFLGSKDHFPLRLERLGWKRSSILFFTLIITIFCGYAAAIVTRASSSMVLLIYATFAVLIVLFTTYLLKAKTE